MNKYSERFLFIVVSSYFLLTFLMILERFERNQERILRMDKKIDYLIKLHDRVVPMPDKTWKELEKLK